MSADPKSLATLAITAANSRKKAAQDLPFAPDNDAGDKGGILKFKSTNEFYAGWTAAFISTTIMFPLNKLIFRQMAGGHRASQAFISMKEDGLRYLYRGIPPPLCQKMVSISIMFGSFDHYKKWADRKFTSAPSVTTLAMAAFMTGATEAILTPLERIQVLLQDRSYHKNFKNTTDAFVKLRKFGIAEYYRGLTCVLARNGPSTMLFFGLRDEVKKLLPEWRSSSSSSATAAKNHKNYHLPPEQQQQDITKNYQPISNNTNAIGEDKPPWSHEFLSGALLGMFISTLFYPVSVVRTRMQTRSPGSKFLSIVEAFKEVYSERDRKFSRFYHGCLYNNVRQFFSWGIINFTYAIVLDRLQNNSN